MAVTFRLKNNTVSAISIPDMGLTIAGSSFVDMAWDDIDKVASCTDLMSYISGGSIILNNGTDLAAANAMLFLNYELGYSGQYALNSHTHTKSQVTDFSHDHNTSYYTQAQIDTKMSTINYAFVTANSSTQTNVTAAELEQLTNGSDASALHRHGTGSGSGSLDEAYNGGKAITVDDGAVDLVAQNGNAPFRLHNITFTPSVNLIGGEMCYRNGEMWFYDQSRHKWLSIAIINIPFNSNNNSFSGYMYYGVVQNTSESGFSMPWPGTIVGLSGNTQNAASTDIEVRVSTETEYTTSWNAGSGYSAIETDIDVDFDILDEIQVYLPGGGTRPNRPNVTLFARKRLD